MNKKFKAVIAAAALAVSTSAIPAPAMAEATWGECVNLVIRKNASNLIWRITAQSFAFEMYVDAAQRGYAARCNF